MFAWLPAAFCFLALGQLPVLAGDLKFEVQLLWGTNDPQPPDSKHKEVAPDVKKKLKELPLKWSNYFEVNRIRFDVPPSGTKRVAISEKCEIEVKDLGHSKIEVTHFGKGQCVYDGTHSLPKGDIFVLGGNAPNSTTWLLVLKRVD